MKFHKDFPFGKGLWIWDLKNCLGGNIDAIIQKCHDYDISYLIIKGGNGGRLWSQLTRDLVNKLHSANIKVYSWTYNYPYNTEYGATPQTEAEVAIKCLDTGVDGHVFDAEAEYRDAPNNSQAAEIMLQAVRAKHPDKFLAHAPLAIIDYHAKFPYATFGKYCDAVMPQAYWGKWTNTAIQQSPYKGMMWVYDNWRRWEQACKDSGHGDCVKPMIPLGQVFDDNNPVYTLHPAHLQEFISTVKGYKSVNFWSFQHLVRTDCWEALRDNKVDAPTDEDRGIVVATEQPQPVHVTTEPTPTTTTESPATPVEQPAEVTPVVEVMVPEVSAETAGTAPVIEATVTGTVESTPEAPTVIPVSVPDNTKSTITIKPDSSHPDGVRVTVTSHKPHIEYVIEFIKFIVSLFKGKK